MSIQATRAYAQNHDELCNSIMSNPANTMLVEGHMGSGKTTLLKMLGEKTKYPTFYVDCTTLDLGDIMIPKINRLEGEDFVSYAINEAFGLHFKDKPIIVMLDEYGKANTSVKLGLTKFLLERTLGNYKLHPKSLLFATTNLSAEGVGDMLQAHQCDRITVAEMRKPTSEEWITWGINNDIDHNVLGFAKEFPHIFDDFRDIKNPDDNPFIFHPQAVGRSKFVTARGLEKASNWLKVRDRLSDNSLMSNLIGTIGERGALDLMSFVKLADQMPRREDIIKDPKTAKIPNSASAVCMVVFSALASMDREYINPWMDYLDRLGDSDAQALFANGVRDGKYNKQSLVMTNAKFTKWSRDNNHMFASDIK
jgi:MoxR-like ATPase